VMPAMWQVWAHPSGLRWALSHPHSHP
jgi:hypothetical protein